MPQSYATNSINQYCKLVSPSHQTLVVAIQEFFSFKTSHAVSVEYICIYIHAAMQVLQSYQMFSSSIAQQQ